MNIEKIAKARRVRPGGDSWIGATGSGMHCAICGLKYLAAIDDLVKGEDVREVNVTV
jgi:hypothetical protein